MIGGLPTEPDVILAAVKNIFHPARIVPGLRVHRRDALATAAAAGSGSPSAVGDLPAATGGAQGRRPWGSDRPVQAPPTSEAEATIQRLIAQADAMARTITDLAFEAWSGTQRCADCRFANAVRMGVSAYCGRCLHAIDALTAAGFGEHMRRWAG